MSRPFGTAEELERRRTKAVQALERGESPTTVARVLGVDVASVHRWRRMARRPGGLAAVEQTGPTPRLNDTHLVSVRPTACLSGREAVTGRTVSQPTLGLPGR